MIKNVVFDNGGVIVQYSAETYLNCFKFNKKIQTTLDSLFVSDEWTLFAKGLLTSSEFKDYAINKFPQYKEKIFKILNAENLKFMIPPYPETIEFINI